MAKERMDIERLLIWAYREELPRLHREPVVPVMRPAWDRISAYAELLTDRVGDGVNRYGVVVDHYLERGPHPDAVLIAEALLEVQSYEPVLPMDAGAVYAAGLGMTAVEVDDCWRQVCDREFFMVSGQARMRRGPAALMHHHAILGGCPDWRGQPVQRHPVLSRGRPAWFVRQSVTGWGGSVHEIEVNGYDERAKRPVKGAYRKYHLAPDPVPVMTGRLEYHAWYLGICAMADLLQDRLATYHPAKTARPELPWIE